MGAKRSYDIFPQTPLARAGLALAFVGGLLAIGTYFAVFFLLADDFFDEPPCSGDELTACLEPQQELISLSNDDCLGSGRRICFAPVGTIDPDLVTNLIQYYRDEYSLEIGVVTPSGIPESFVDASRHQLDVTALADLVGHVHWFEVGSPEIVLIVLTPVDLYDKTSHYRFVFGVRASYDEPSGVVSTYRMHLGAFGLVDDEKVFERTRKMVTKYIGLLYYGLEESDDPESPLYGGILSIGDLDRMGDRLPLEDVQ